MPHASPTATPTSTAPTASPPKPHGPDPAPPDPSKPTTLDDLLADLNRTPLFMTHLDATDGAGGSNVALDALRALAYEGPRSEVAANFREQGNECARAKRWGDAREFYTRALEVVRGEVELTGQEGEGKGEGAEVDWLDEGEGRGRVVVDVEEEERREREVEVACVGNRALCNLEMKNYGQATRDAAATLSLQPTNTKAYYRSALALLALDKLDSALQAIDLGIPHIPPTSTPSSTRRNFDDLRKRILDRQSVLRRRERERVEREQKARFEALKLRQALKRRGMVVKAERGPDMEDASIALEDASDAESELRTPVLLLYPTAGQSELVKVVREGETMGDVLGMVLPVPWVEGGEFGGADGEGVEIFVETAAGGLRKVGKRVAWGRVIRDGGVDVGDGLARVFVVPKGRVEGWVGEWKKSHGKG